VLSSVEDAQFLTKVDVGAPRALVAEPRFRAARVSPDGQHAAFLSYAPLTGADNVDAVNGKSDGETFLFDAGDQRLRCVSCSPSGTRPVGQAVGSQKVLQVAASIPTWPNQTYPSRALSDDGRRVFFETSEALLPRDTNGVQDIYEWQAGESQAQCAALGTDLFLQREGGCLSLISTGESPSDSRFVDASASGRDVFLSTVSSLVPQDPGQVDIYDAREGGGFPPPPSPPAACEGEACQGPFSPPNDPTPASLSFRGAGNLTERKAKKAQRKKKNVKKHKSAKKHKKKGHAQRQRAAHNRGGHR